MVQNHFRPIEGQCKSNFKRIESLWGKKNRFATFDDINWMLLKIVIQSTQNS